MRALSWMIALAILGTPISQAAAQSGKRLIVTFKSGTNAEARAKALVALGVKPEQKVDIVASNDTRQTFSAAIVEGNMALNAAPEGSDIEKVEEDYKIRWIEAMPSFSAPTTSFKDLGLSKFSSSRSMAAAAVRDEITWGIRRVKAPAAWDYTEGAGVRVAVIDTGIDSSHRDLSAKVDGGYNAETDCERAECWQDDNGHGTHVAGTIGGQRDGRGVVGVAPKARLYAVKVLDADGSGSLSNVIKGIIWAANNGMQVANMSLGSPMPSETMQRALKYAKAKGVIVVCAAGNSGGSVGYPGAYPEVIAVSAADSKDAIASFSSRGDEVDFIAPGVSIVSSAMGGDYANFSGTSMASPHVAGLAALAVSQGWRGLDGPDGVMEQLKKAAKPLANLTAQEQGNGMIDAEALVRGPQVMASAAR